MNPQEDAMTHSITSEIGHANAGTPDRLIYYVVTETGRVVGEYRTLAAARRRTR